MKFDVLNSKKMVMESMQSLFIKIQYKMHYLSLSESKAPTQVSTTRAALLNRSIQAEDDTETVTIEMRELSSQKQQSFRDRSNSLSRNSDTGLRRRKKTVSHIRVSEQEKYSERVKDQNGEIVDYGVEEVKYLLNSKDSPHKARENQYDMWDLTYTLITAKVPVGIVTFLFLIFVLIRYYTFACLIFMAAHSNSKDIWWVFVIVADRLLYMVLVMKISLETAETRTEKVLKSHWDSKQSSINEYFETIDAKKLITSIIRGTIPAELAFVYIRGEPRKRFELYTAINYINASIQAIIYYPFFILYCYFLTSDNTFALNEYYQGATIGLAAFAEFMMLVATVILVVKGAKRKYGKAKQSS